MTSTRRISLALVLAAIGGCAHPPRTVVVVSLDGFRHDYPARASTPAFDQLAREGARAARLDPPFPSQTFASHATLATGVSPATHGIVNNRFRDPKRGRYRLTDDVTWYDVDPLWIYTTKRGLRTHVFHWVASAGARGGVEPAWWRRFDPAVGDDAKIAQVITWALAPRAIRPRLIMAYLAGCDRPGHLKGPASPEVTACIAATDARLARLLGALSSVRHRTSLLVVSDHGMTETLGELNPQVAIDEANIDGVEVIAHGPVANVYAPAAAVDQVVAAARRVPHTTTYRRAALPAQWRYAHPTRTGDVVIVAADGYRFNERRSTVSAAPTHAGHHGHGPAHPDMGAVLFAWGAGVRAGSTVARAHAVDVVPTVCALLDLSPPSGVEGKALTALLE